MVILRLFEEVNRLACLALTDMAALAKDGTVGWGEEIDHG
jgi:hypothetical protein